MTARAVVLGLVVSPFGVRVTAATVGDGMAPQAMEPLAGVVAAPHDFRSKPAYLGSLLSKDLDMADGCGPSGCFADLLVDEMFSAEYFSQLATATRRTYVRVANYGTLDATTSSLNIAVDSSAEILSAPGCVSAGDGSWNCDLGTVAAGGYWATVVSTVGTASGGSGEFIVSANVSSPDDTDPGDNSNEWPLFFDDSGVQARTTHVDAGACPAMTADVSFTTALGEVIPGGLQGAYPTTDVFENGDWLGAPLIDQPVDEPLSLAIVVDNSAAVDPVKWSAVKSSLSDIIDQWSAVNGAPLPAVAIYEASSFRRLGGFSNDPATVEPLVDSMDPSPLPTELYRSLRGAVDDLSGRNGRRALIVIDNSIDAHDGNAQIALRDAARAAGVTIYGVSLTPSVEPLMRFLSTATHGLRQSVVEAGDIPGALQRIADELRNPNRMRWSTVATGESDRELVFDFYHDDYDYLDVSTFYSQTGTPCATMCAAIRGLQPRYGENGELDVMIDLSALDGSAAEIRETLPIGAYPYFISDGGTWEEQLGQVRWSFPAGTAPPILSYTTTTPGAVFPDDDDVAVHFQGSISVDGATPQPVCGDALTRPIGAHPADFEADFTMPRYLVDAYTRAWQAGSAWMSGPADIPIAYVSRARELQRQGQFYYVDVDQDPPWVNQSPMPDPGARSAVRSLPAFYTPGVPFDVTIDVDPGSLGTAVAIEDVPPADWTPTNISDGGVYSTISRKIRWELPSGNAPLTLSYTLEADQAAPTPVVFTGTLSVDGFNSGIGGASVVSTQSQDPIFSNGFE